jgi:hypothetical protein
MGSHMEVLTDNLKRLWDAAPQDVGNCLELIVTAAKGIQAKAEKLMAANK